MNDNIFGVLQNDTDVVKDLPGLCNGKCPSSSEDANQPMSFKVEEVSNVQEEETPVPITWPTIKAEHEVSLCLFGHW
jgi:hypothetical protein